MDERDAFSPAETEERLGISHTLLYELIRSGELRSFKIGARRFISAKAIHDLIAKREVGSRA